MSGLDQNSQNEKCAPDVIQQERAMYTVAAELLVMNRLLEEDQRKSANAENRSAIKSFFHNIKLKFKKRVQ